MNRRRPIPRSAYSYLAQPKSANALRFELLLGGAVRKYPDGREVCQDSPKGWAEYKRRVQVMLQRQNFKCCLCKKCLNLADATFEHQRRRGMPFIVSRFRYPAGTGNDNGCSFELPSEVKATEAAQSGRKQSECQHG
jgi:hypothetical protein